MKKWYKESYFNSTNWILENYDKLSLSTDEAFLIILIDYCNKNNISVTYELLQKKLNKTVKEIDILTAGLVNKHYLKLSTNSKGLVFDIDSIYEFDPSAYEVSENKDVYDLVEQVFNKPLSSTELIKMNELINEYGQTKFIEALRIADANRKVKMAYIEGILRNEK